MLSRTGLALALLCGTSATALADDGPYWQFGARVIGVLPNEEADIVPIGGDVEIDDAFVPELNINYFFNKNVAAELILATAPHEVVHTPTNLDVGEVWLLPPTLTLQYHFQPDDAQFRPYVGAGINYTFFYNVNDTAPGLDVDYDDSFGFVLQAGFDIPITDTLSFNLDVKRVWLNTDVTIAPLGVTADVDIDPWIVGIGVHFRF